jgi:hypothetical protein
MRPLFLGLACSVSFLLGVAVAAKGVAAAKCGEPVAAPKWEIGDNWTIQDELGDERTETVVGFEGALARVESQRTGRKTLRFFDADQVLRKVIEPDGAVLDTPGQRGYTFLRLKTLEFPLQVGKTWHFTFAQGKAMYWREYRVVACEEITIVAGKFSALKIEATNRRVGARGEGSVRHEWYAPAAKRIIRGTYRRRDQGNALFVWELLRYRVN